MSELKRVLCSNPSCKKVVGEIATGKARFKCKVCGTYTTIEITPEPPKFRPGATRLAGPVQ